MKKLFSTSFILFTILALTYSFTNVLAQDNKLSVNSLSKNKGGSCNNLTLEKYKKIENKMTYKEVVEIMGCEGTETMSSGSGKYKVQSYQWKGENYKFLSIVLSGGKVVSKTQANLE